MRWTVLPVGTVPLLPKTEAWHCQIVGWSFMILAHPRKPSFYCSYQLNNEPAVFFKGDAELQPKGYWNVPSSYGFDTLRSAKVACERKYRELLLR